MKRTVIAAGALSFAFATSVFAAEGGAPSNGQNPNFEQRKAEILARFNERETFLQQAISCIQAAQNYEDIKTCKEKHLSEMNSLRPGMGKQSGPGGNQGR